MGPSHHHDEVRARLGHHLGFEVTAVHRLQVGDDRMSREPRAKALDRPQPFGEDQRRTGLEPVDAGIDADRGSLQCLLQRGQVEGELNDRVGQAVDRHGGQRTITSDARKYREIPCTRAGSRIDAVAPINRWLCYAKSPSRSSASKNAVRMGSSSCRAARLFKGCFFIAGNSARHDGPERVWDLLNSEAGFFPFEVHDSAGARTVLFNRDHVVTVVLSDNEASRDSGYTVATRRAVSMRLSTGEQITGAVCVYRPEGRDRLSDWARQSDAVPLRRKRRRPDDHRQQSPTSSRSRRERHERCRRSIRCSARCARRARRTCISASASPPMIRKDGHMQPLDAAGAAAERGRPGGAPGADHAGEEPEGVRRAARHRLRLRDSGAGALPVERVRRSPRARGGVPRHPVEDPDRRAARSVVAHPAAVQVEQGSGAGDRARPARASRRRCAR